MASSGMGSLPHGIPDFCDHPNIVSVKSGSWSDPKTWSLNRVPTDGDQVEITSGITVIYDIKNLAMIHVLCIEEGSSLKFRNDIDTQLRIGTLLVKEEGVLEIGTAQVPIQPNVIAEIIVCGCSHNFAADPEQFGVGIIGLGKVTMHGAVKAPTFVRLSKEPRAGDIKLFLNESVQGWRPQDRLILPDTRQIPFRKNSFSAAFPQWEELTVENVSGNEVTLSHYLQFDHLGAHSSNGNMDFLAHVGNLSRNVIIRSESPDGIRGHTLFTHRADVDIRYVLFKDLGRTTVDIFDNTVFDKTTGAVTHIGTNQKGRYTLHAHHLMGPVNPTNQGYQFKFVGNAIVGGKRWGITIHNSHYGLIRGNVVYDVNGAGIITEDGNESYNEIERNFAVRIRSLRGADRGGVMGGGKAKEPGLPELETETGFEGTAFWFRGPHNYVRDNVAANASFSGYDYNGYYHSGMAAVPKFRGADTSIIREVILYNSTNNRIPSLKENLRVLESSRNEVYGFTRIGFWATWYCGTMPLSRYIHEGLFKDYDIWHVTENGVEPYHTSRMTFENFRIKNDPAVTIRNQGEGKISRGFDFSKVGYENGRMIVRNPDVEGFNIGIDLPRQPNAETNVQTDHTTLLEDGRLKNHVNIREHISRLGHRNVHKEAIIRNVKFESLHLPAVGLPFSPLAIEMSADLMSESFTLSLSNTYVYDFNQIQGDNFQIFFPEQVPTYGPIPQSFYPNGLPESGLTNQDAWKKYNTAIAGALTSCATSRQGIKGFVCPLVIPSDTISPVISGINVTVISSTEVRIIWKTNEPATTQLLYGIDPQKGNAVKNLSPVDANLATAHVQMLTGLTPQAKYKYQIRAKDASGNEAFSNELGFVMR